MLKWMKVFSVAMLIGVFTLLTASPTEAAPSNPKSVIDEEPDAGGYWMGPSSSGDPSSEGDTVTDATSTAGVASALAGGVPGVTAKIVGGSGGVASAIAALNIDTTYYYQYDYIASEVSGYSVETATVTYYFSESTRDAESYIDSSVSYGSKTE
ncbi:hypothetical protein [Alteribacillus sp. HJP-4]|uniref:hypothetical protein n=1 Tax=Alteribacillus sp. HJP-4 TaxID=2775394 RepID=UPI0035CD1BDA